MMSGDNFTDGFGKTRPALANVTNLERGFLFGSGDLGLKSGDGYGGIVDGEDGNLRIAKKVCLGVDNSVKNKCEIKFGVVDVSEKDLSPTCSEVGTSLENIASDVVNLPNKSKETSNFFDGIVCLVKDDRKRESSVEVGDASRESCVSSVLMPVFSEPCKKDCRVVGGKCRDEEVRLTSGVTQQSSVGIEGLVTRVFKDNEKDLGLGNLASSNYGSIESSRFPKSQGSRFHQLERCIRLKGDGCTNLNAGDSILKGCSCSFCLTAGYIWSDLHYQDIKGRISVLKKSQKEASVLVQRLKETDTHGQGNSKSLNLESDLTSQWKSLFIRMEDIFVHESNQLQASFNTLKDLRENCKMDLEMINGMASDKL
ncbi:hypothetical protein CMV_002424 [Castanea mollissima]|uniref:Uncharacterized protein n=1 Tax=Castanea mollissima TaxID=60419 RepID=A0A8J4W3P3_9ROSI|nr:hypothetical protein CMV_002424 [Castanea mollissima]